ncbi:MAG TPA: primosomal protein N' [Bacteroidetes bacterium]|nr:primosomal protein N' [Bacteroidota bacterium]
MRLAQVVPLTPVEGPFTYCVPPELDAEVVPGARVLVPFGRRQLTGVVVRTGDGEAPKAKPVLDVLDDRPALTVELLGLTKWVAEYYLCTWGEAIKAALPSGTEVETRRVVHALAETWPEADGQAVLGALAAAGGGLKVPALAEALGRKTAPQSLLRRMEAAGAVRIEQELQEARAKPKIEKHLTLAVTLGEASSLRGAKQLALAAVLAAADEPVRQSEALKESGASSGTVKSLVEKGMVEVHELEVERTADEAEAPPPPPADVTLHPAQTAALEALRPPIEAGEPYTVLLHGVTGSGKTEVYLRALAAVLERGKSGIVLVPEIALTPQTVRRFRAHFGDRVAVLHSRMSPGERLDAWTRIRDGQYPVVIGPRSAVFAPVQDLGIILVDEEHEASYKQFDPAPRYHARDVAVMRAHRADAVCVLGSATPSLETAANARSGKYAYLAMPDRVPVSRKEEGASGKEGTSASALEGPGLDAHDSPTPPASGAEGESASRQSPVLREPAPLPTVRVVDLAREKEIRRLKGALSHDLREAMQARLDRGEQIILLQNRRGYAPVITCETCGWTPECRDCAVSLTLHKTNRTLRCHYCGRAERQPTACPECGADDLRLLGSGTQRVEEEIAEVFPDARLLRMDLDTTSRKGAHARLLEQFGDGEADILLGTQMVAKGLDFPRVTLVGVVNADTGMLLPDFRAAERTFQLLAQVAGRAGRHDLPGEVILQTRNPEHPAIQHALAHDYAAFARYELVERHALGYPPYGRLVGAEIKGTYEGSTNKLAQAWTDALARHAARIEGAEVLGPVAAFVGKVKGFWRVHTHLKAPRSVPAAALAEAVRAATAEIGTPPKGHRINIDVDPVGLY